jgi:hypothetical protein
MAACPPLVACPEGTTTSDDNYAGVILDAGLLLLLGALWRVSTAYNRCGPARGAAGASAGAAGLGAASPVQPATRALQPSNVTPPQPHPLQPDAQAVGEGAAEGDVGPAGPGADHSAGGGAAPRGGQHLERAPGGHLHRRRQYARALSGALPPAPQRAAGRARLPDWPGCWVLDAGGAGRLMPGAAAAAAAGGPRRGGPGPQPQGAPPRLLAAGAARHVLARRDVAARCAPPRQAGEAARPGPRRWRRPLCRGPGRPC